MSIDQMVVKKEKTSSSLLPKGTLIDLAVKTLGSQKRKSVEVFELGDLEADDALKNFIYFLHSISIHVFSYIFFQFPHHCLLEVVGHISHSTEDLKATIISYYSSKKKTLEDQYLQ